MTHFLTNKRMTHIYLVRFSPVLELQPNRPLPFSYFLTELGPKTLKNRFKPSLNPYFQLNDPSFLKNKYINNETILSTHERIFRYIRD